MNEAKKKEKEIKRNIKKEIKRLYQEYIKSDDDRVEVPTDRLYQALCHDRWFCGTQEEDNFKTDKKRTFNVSRYYEWKRITRTEILKSFGLWLGIPTTMSILLVNAIEIVKFIIKIFH